MNRGTQYFTLGVGSRPMERARPLTGARRAILMPASPALTNLLRAPELALPGDCCSCPILTKE
jgi:hypothetical protein